MFPDLFWKTYEETTAKDFGMFISILLNNIELKTKEVADIFRVSDAYIRTIKLGRKKPSKKLVRGLFEFLNFNPNLFPKCVKVISERDKNEFMVKLFVITCLTISNETKKGMTENEIFEFIKNELN